LRAVPATVIATCHCHSHRPCRSVRPSNARGDACGRPGRQTSLCRTRTTICSDRSLIMFSVLSGGLGGHPDAAPEYPPRLHVFGTPEPSFNRFGVISDRICIGSNRY
jgi:hypothetical protein